MQTRWFSEIDPYASAVLRKHWADVPNHGDIRNVGQGTVEPVDVLCGGFPCQDISNAGRRAGIDGERSGLWAEYARVIGELRPRYVIVENVAALLGRGLGRVLGDLAALGFDAEWHCIPASAVGAPHRRDRIWIVADSRQQRECSAHNDGCCVERGGPQGREQLVGDSGGGADVAYAGRDGRERRRGLGQLDGASSSREGAEEERERVRNAVGDCGANVAYADEPRLERWLRASLHECADQRIARARGPYGWNECEWFAESGMGRISDGVRNRVDRLRCLGNAIVPQIAEIIGRAILKAHQ